MSSAAALLIVMLSMAGQANSSAFTGTVTGRVVDQSGGQIPGVTILATDGAHQLTAVTTVTGEYRLAALPAGTYKLQASMPGFVTIISEPLVVGAGRALTWNVILAVRGYDGTADPSMGLRPYIERFTGKDALDCRRPDLRDSMACGLDAAAQKQSFWAFEAKWGVDSWIASGFLGTSTGAIHRFSYDSAPCGGPGCAGLFTIEACPHLDVETNSQTGRQSIICRQ